MGSRSRMAGSRWSTWLNTLHNLPYQNFGGGLRGGALGLLAAGCGPLHTAFLAEPPPITLSEQPVDLGTAPLDGLAEGTVTVTSTVARSVRVSVTRAAADSGAPEPRFVVTPAVFELAPGATQELRVRFSPDGALGSAAQSWAVRAGDAEALWLQARSAGVPDHDQDGYAHPLVGGTDCDDADPDVSPGADEVWYDGVDDDCDGNDADQDADGWAAEAAGGDDCDDTDPAVHPDAVEVWYDGVDDDCDGNDADQDGDGHEAAAAGGDDCDDTDPTTSPSDPDPYDLVDNDCDGIVDEDALPDGALWVTEWRAAGGAAGPWLELTARDWRPWDLNGWTLESDGGAAPLPETVLPPGETLVLCADLAQAEAAGLPCDAALSPWPDLAAEAGALSVGPPGRAIDAVAWDAAWSPATAGSLQLDGGLLADADLDPTRNDAPSAWCASEALGPDGAPGSPGAVNPACPPAMRR